MTEFFSEINFREINFTKKFKKLINAWIFVPGLSCSSSSASPPSPSSSHLDQDSNIYETRSCARCNKLYSVFKDTGECVQPEACVYHWGKPRSSSRKYSCCGRRMKTNFSGCETASSHVWRGILYEISGERGVPKFREIARNDRISISQCSKNGTIVQ